MNFSKVLCGLLMISGSLVASDDRASTQEELEQHRQMRALEQDLSAPIAKSAVYVSVHPGAYHFPVAYSYLGDTVDTEDGARYVTAPEDRSLIFKWFSGDTIILVRNHALFSNYYFKLINLNTNDVVKVNLLFKPIKNSIYTYWIQAIDTVSSVVLLNDGTLWSVSGFDTSVMRTNWQVYDTVIMGINDDWISGSYGNFLYNVDANNIVRSQCQF